MQLWNAAPAEPLLSLFHAIGCALVGAVVCRDPMEAVPGVWGCLSKAFLPKHKWVLLPAGSRFKPMCVCQLWAC